MYENPRFNYYIWEYWKSVIHKSPIDSVDINNLLIAWSKLLIHTCNLFREIGQSMIRRIRGYIETGDSRFD